MGLVFHLGYYSFGQRTNDNSTTTKPVLTTEPVVSDGLPSEGYWTGDIVWRIPPGCYADGNNYGIADWYAKYSEGPKLYDFRIGGFGFDVAGPGTVIEGKVYRWDYPVGAKNYKVEGKRTGDTFKGTVVMNYKGQRCSDRVERWRTIYFDTLEGDLTGTIETY